MPFFSNAPVVAVATVRYCVIINCEISNRHNLSMGDVQCLDCAIENALGVVKIWVKYGKILSDFDP